MTRKRKPADIIGKQREAAIVLVRTDRPFWLSLHNGVATRCRLACELQTGGAHLALGEIEGAA